VFADKPTMGIYTDINLSMAEIWKQHNFMVRTRVQMLQRAADAMLFGRLQPELEARATTEAHTLRGEFGTFGYHDAATAAAEAESILKDTWRRSPADASELQQLVQMLKRELEESTAAA
jgi:HPt (histidine-containing phosphotransfer) domain-containing protein